MRGLEILPARMKAIAIVALLVAPLALAGCQDSITDVGSLEDADLDDEAALQSIVNGMGRELSIALGHLALTGAAVSREVVGTGSQTNFGITLGQREGILEPVETDEHWNTAQSARWTAEDGVRRMRALLGDGFASSELAARALLYVGFANRLLGENMCFAVIDGGQEQPAAAFLSRAEAAFTESLAIAERIGSPDLALAARAGRASARVGLGDWAGARSDAEAVPIGFEHAATYSDRELEQYNPIYWANAGLPYRNLSVWSTFYDAYFALTGDPRVRWTIDPAHPEGDTGIPLQVEQKYTGRNQPIRLVTGREMRLIVAEGRLRAGDVTGALDAINELRLLAGVEPATAEDLPEAWTALKRERGIELWLEGRRLGDLHRWIAEAAPGEAEDMSGRDTCFPIGTTELDTNPNLP
jgi:hypothetical protein